VDEQINRRRTHFGSFESKVHTLTRLEVKPLCADKGPLAARSIVAFDSHCDSRAWR